ncbi:DUF2726 domain-containing protein [Microvirga aerilata]|uniref:DUF2726 domain-containing protein n=1 Tax=Microvirga aerilata TaxID=670292 RepID=UPI003643A988
MVLAGRVRSACRHVRPRPLLDPQAALPAAYDHDGERKGVLPAPPGRMPRLSDLAAGADPGPRAARCEGGSRAFWTAFRRISNTRVDWAIVQDLEVLAIVELDDRSHDARKDAQQDRILKSCGYRVVRFSSSRRPDPRQIHEAVFNPE